MLESAYELCLAHDLRAIGLRIEIQKALPLRYRGLELDCVYRLDRVVEGKLVLELKAVEVLLPLHRAQLLSSLRVSNYRVGPLINFNVPMLRKGIHRLVHNGTG